MAPGEDNAILRIERSQKRETAIKSSLKIVQIIELYHLFSLFQLIYQNYDSGQVLHDHHGLCGGATTGKALP
ncbi:hypothetical protein [Consotaella aegiceratis]|uniref:hypothetical protein n=1 Tax=Consotaella aegiceratis TaxID=3097961 RepID=UPI002F41D05B